MLERLKRIWYRSIMNKDLSYKEVKQIINKDKTAILLDVRSKQEYLEGHLPQSINISLFDLEKSIQNVIKDKSKTIITCCSSGNRSKKAQELLERMGYENVYNLKGGLDYIDF